MGLPNGVPIAPAVSPGNYFCRTIPVLNTGGRYPPATSSKPKPVDHDVALATFALFAPLNPASPPWG